MKKPESLCFLLFAFILTGCYTGGRTFTYQNRNALELGKTTSDEAIQLLGKPKSIKSVSKPDSNYLTLRYEYISGFEGLYDYRILMLDFKNDTLAAKIYNSNFTKDATDFNYSASKKIKSGVTTKDSVLKILGPPTAMAIYPSHLSDFKELKCDSADIIWGWYFSEVFNRVLKIKEVKIVFDKKGVVCNMNASEQN